MSAVSGRIKEEIGDRADGSQEVAARGCRAASPRVSPVLEELGLREPQGDAQIGLECLE